MKKKRLPAGLMILGIFVLFLSSIVFAADQDKDNMLIIVPGTIQSAVNPNSSDWDASDKSTQMMPLGNGMYDLVITLPKGIYAYKVALNGTWDLNYGANGVQGGPNIKLEIPKNDFQVRFLFDAKTGIIKDSVNSNIKSYRLPKKVELLGIDDQKLILKEADLSKLPVKESSDDIYSVTATIPAGEYTYQIRYNDDAELVYGEKGIKKADGIKLNLDKDTEVTFYHNFATHVSYDSVNYIPVAENEKPMLAVDSFQPLVLNDNDRDNIYTGVISLPAGKKDYTFSLKMGNTEIAREVINFNEKISDYKVAFKYDHKNKKFTSDYVAKATGPDNRVVAQNLYFNSRDLGFKKPFGAIPLGTEVTFTLAAKANDLEKARLVIQRQRIVGDQFLEEYLDTVKYSMHKIGYSKDGATEYWQIKYRFNNIGVFGYYFEAVDGSDMVVYGNNDEIVPVPYHKVTGTGAVGKWYDRNEIRFVRYLQTVYDPQFKVPDWAKDAIFYQIFPDRFKNGDKANDPKRGIDKFYGKKEIELHKNWTDKKPWLPGKADGNESDDGEYCNDFYGGDLAGILQKLDYLKDLGINTIYLNPIFESPSNYKYDTTDYMHVDNNFGTNELFKQLVEEAKKRGIGIMLDVSINHTSHDSMYMDRFGKYPSLGAFEKGKIRKDSPYYDWYEFNPNWNEETDSGDLAYNRWTGVVHMPNLNKKSDSLKDFLFRNPDSVMKYWMDMGIKGWRMDVAAWVTVDEYWKEWRSEVKAKDPNVFTVGESWFNSAKYLTGDTFDSVMNYIFMQIALDFADGKDAQAAYRALEMVRESYPEQAMYTTLNLMGSHDIGRVLYRLGYKEEGESAEDVKAAKQKDVLALFFQMTYPGAPCIYYGDEVGMTGSEDPFNRGPYPWKEDGGKPDDNLLKEFKKLIKLRNDNEVLRRGTLSTIYVDENVIVMLREYKGKIALVAMNNAGQAKTIKIDAAKLGKVKAFSDALEKGKTYAVVGQQLTIDIPARYGRVLVTK